MNKENVFQQEIGRFIEDLLFIWDGSPDLIKGFQAYLNGKGFNLEFSLKYDAHERDFLDLKLRGNASLGTIESEVFRKWTADNTILKANIGCPSHTKCSIPYSQFMRDRRNCSSDKSFKEQSAELSDNIEKAILWTF